MKLATFPFMGWSNAPAITIDLQLKTINSTSSSLDHFGDDLLK
jgi:hypothetical protein